MDESKGNLAVFLLIGPLLMGFMYVSAPTVNNGVVPPAAQIGSSISTPALAPNSVANQSAKVDLYASAFAPTGDLTEPYIILTAFGTTPSASPIGIRGDINGSLGFTCSTVPCKLPLTADSAVHFLADNGQGRISQTYTAIVRLSKPSTSTFNVILESFSPEQIFVDSCYSIWGGPPGQNAVWSDQPRTPYQLNTDVTLYLLATRLIQSGMVNVSSCPSGGMENGSPNGCGIEQARQAMIEWQNKYDFDIWAVANSTGVPPKIIKTLIMQESQFWPGNSHYFFNEYGLGQINDMGIDVALRWDINLYQQVCSSLKLNCNVPYNMLPENVRSMIRGALLNQINADCPTCTNGVNMDIAHSSVDIIAHVMRANCWETRYILDKNKVTVPNYEDFWKFTLVSYHSGFDCLDVAIAASSKVTKSLNWNTLAPNLTCTGAGTYVNNFWNSLLAFDNKVMQPQVTETASVNTLATRTPLPPPAAILSKASVRVSAFIDKNGNNLPDPFEGISGVLVKLTMADGTTKTGTTDKLGQTVFDLTGSTVGDSVNISLVNYYRSKSLTVPETGIVDVLFNFVQPSMPTALP